MSRTRQRAAVRFLRPALSRPHARADRPSGLGFSRSQFFDLVQGIRRCEFAATVFVERDKLLIRIYLADLRKRGEGRVVGVGVGGGGGGSLQVTYHSLLIRPVQAIEGLSTDDGEGSSHGP